MVAVSGGFLCFGDGTQVELPGGGVVSVESLVEGNVTSAVDTMGNFSRAHAKVGYAKREVGAFSGRTLHFGQYGKTITVTDNHLMLVKTSDQVKLREAQDIVVGDLLLPAEYDGSSHPLEVVAVDAVVMGARNIVATSEGTILAERLSVSAMCDAPPGTGHDSDALHEITQSLCAEAVVQLWKAQHVLEK